MRASQMKSLLALAAAIGAGTAAAAGWDPVVKMNGQSVDLDTSRIGKLADGRATAWTRLALDRDYIDETGMRYTMVEALNRYDCEKHSFTTLKRVFIRDSKLVRRETIGTPREMNAEPGSPDDQLLNRVCKTAVAAVSPGIGAPVVDAKPSVLHADVRAAEAATPGKDAKKADKDAKAADAKKAEAPADGASGERPRYIDLPKIDKSKVEDPNAAAKSAADGKDAKKADKNPPAAKAEKAAPVERPKTAEKLPSYRAELERLYASSGPRRAPKAKKAEPEPVAPPRDIPWSYEGDGAPANWGKLRPDYATCGNGKRQSPIDIRDTIRVDLEPINFEYRLSHFSIIDTGHTIQVNVSEGSSIRVMDRVYQLIEFHFHKPAEERINGRGFEMVVHLVHRDEAGQMAVIAVPLEKGPEHPLIQAIWNSLPLDKDRQVTPSWFIDPNLLLPPPERRAYYTYLGSETTPPCAEDVLWMVFKQPVSVSAQQIGIFSHLYPNNARPIQPSNGRLIKENR